MIVYILTRPYENDILGVYSKREYAELHKNQCMVPEEMRIESHTLDYNLDELQEQP